jgi:nucleoside-diphosphate-sugar epimerase
MTAKENQISLPNMDCYDLLRDDLANVFNSIGIASWSELRGQRIFLTGGTGFFGKWLVKSWAYANAQLKLNSEMHVLSRDPERFITSNQEFANIEGLSFVRGELQSFVFPDGDFKYVIHAAMDMKQSNESKLFTESLAGSTRLAQFCAGVGTQKVLLISSGAVYGPQPPELRHVSEDYNGYGDTDSLLTGYAVSKRAAEWIFRNDPLLQKINVTIARCYAFAGPHLPLDGKYALSHFISSLLEGKPIKINGDGRSLRSYLYASDLTTWLWRILFSGKDKSAYNVGSDREISIAELASQLIAIADADPESDSRSKNQSFSIAGNPIAGKLPERYVPSVEKAKSELGVKILIDEDAALKKTWSYFNRTMRRSHGHA